MSDHADTTHAEPRSAWLPGPVWWFALLATVAFAASVCVDVARVYTPVEAFRAVLVQIGLAPASSMDPLDAALLGHWRLARASVAALAGGMLALAGAITQGIFRNPLAAPSVIGVTAGGGLGGALALALGLPLAGLRVGEHTLLAHYLAVPLFAFAGACLVAFAVYAIATRRGETHLPTLLLAGIALSALAAAGASVLLTFALHQDHLFRAIFLWQMGSLQDRLWAHVVMLLPGLALGSLIALGYVRELNLLAMGERSAASLGVDVARMKRRLLVAAALLAGSAVSVIGLVGFVGLVVPHLVRLLIGPDHRTLLPASLFAGASLLLTMDLVQRVVVVGWLRTPELRIGAIMGLIGGTFFVVLLLRQRHRHVG